MISDPYITPDYRGSKVWKVYSQRRSSRCCGGKQLPRRALRLLETKMSPELVLRTTAQTGSIGGHCLLDVKTLESRNSRFK